MTKEDLEELAVGMETGFTDRNGQPIKVGDDITLYHKSITYVGFDHLNDYPEDRIVSDGFAGYVYTGKVIRQHHTVRFTFMRGLEMTSTGKWKFLYERDLHGNLASIVVGKRGPKLTFEELMESIV